MTVAPRDAACTVGVDVGERRPSGPFSMSLDDAPPAAYQASAGGAPALAPIERRDPPVRTWRRDAVVAVTAAIYDGAHTVPDIAAATSLGPDRVRRALRWMVQKQWVERQRRHDPHTDTWPYHYTIRKRTTTPGSTSDASTDSESHGKTVSRQEES